MQYFSVVGIRSWFCDRDFFFFSMSVATDTIVSILHLCCRANQTTLVSTASLILAGFGPGLLLLYFLFRNQEY